MTDTQAADRLLEAAVTQGRVPGIVAMAATREGVLYEGAFGNAALGGDVPMRRDTIFFLASMTKAVTSVAAMQLVEAGRIGLDEPLGAYLEELRAPLVLDGFDSGGEPILRPARGAVTLRHLLTHTAGYGYEQWNPVLARYMKLAGIPNHHSGSEKAYRAPLLFDPGTRWQYGINTDLVGRLVAQLSGEGLGAYMRTHILEPLGMRNTGFGIPPEKRGRVAGRHKRSPEGVLSRTPFEPPEAPKIEAGGGGLFSTGPDYLRFLRMLLRGGELDGARVLQAETVAEMGRNQIGALEVSALPESEPPGFSNRAEFFPGMVKKWGLGFLLNTEAGPGGRAAGSLAWAGIANTYYWIDPAQGVTGLLLTQILPFADPTVLDLLEGFEREVYAGRREVR